MSIKIQINSLKALERLIGGDSDLEMDIRNSVVQAFAKKHLKALAVEELEKVAKKVIEKELFHTNSFRTLTLNEAHTKTLKRIAATTINEVFGEIIAGIVEEGVKEEKIKDVCKNALSHHLSNLVSKFVEGQEKE